MYALVFLGFLGVAAALQYELKPATPWCLVEELRAGEEAAGIWSIPDLANAQLTVTVRIIYLLWLLLLL